MGLRDFLNNRYLIVSVTPDLALDLGYTYAGGLGVLEGDKFYAASVLGLNYVVISPYYTQGYVSYEFDGNDNPRPKPQEQPEDFIKALKLEDRFKVRIRNEDVEVEALTYVLNSAKAVFVKPTQPEWAVKLYSRLYIEDSVEERFYKYTLLARAAAEYLRRNVSVSDIAYIDLQEAYTAFMPLTFKIPGKYRLVIHTAGPWGHPSFPRSLIELEYGYRLIPSEVVMTEVGLAAVDQAFAVSAKHLSVLVKMFPHYSNKLTYVTNGINLDRWMHPRLKELYENHKLTLDAMPEVKEKVKNELSNFLSGFKDVSLDKKAVLLWGRRVTTYKRPWFIAQLAKELKNAPVVIVIAGKAHPHDGVGLEYMKTFRRLSKEQENVVYIPEYTVDVAKKLLSSADIHLFTPFSGWEACGTSYMKAAVNAVPTITSRDGATLEYIIDGVNGWFFGRDLRTPLDLASPEASEINDVEYREFKELTFKVLNMLSVDPESYYRVALSAMRSFIPRASMIRVLREYYPQLIKFPTV